MLILFSKLIYSYELLLAFSLCRLCLILFSVKMPRSSLLLTVFNCLVKPLVLLYVPDSHYNWVIHAVWASSWPL